MPITPTGIYAGAMATLRTMLSNSASFQTEVGADDAAEALAFIYQVRIDDPTQDCFIILGFGPVSRQIVSRGARNYFTGNGQLNMKLIREVKDSEKADYSDTFVAFGNLIGGILADVEALSGTGGNLNITGFEVGEAMDSVEKLEDNDTITRRDMIVEVDITWSDGRD